MRILLDTHILLWMQYEPEKLDPALLELIVSSADEVFFSPVSIWEIAIKASLGRKDFPASPRKVLEASTSAGFIELPLSSNAAVQVRDLPTYHFDPFDRILIAQAIDARARLCTSDKAIARYSHLVEII